MLAISQRLRQLATEDGILLITPDELLEEIADIIDQELGLEIHVPNTSEGAQAMGIDTIKEEQQ